MFKHDCYIRVYKLIISIFCEKGKFPSPPPPPPPIPILKTYSKYFFMPLLCGYYLMVFIICKPQLPPPIHSSECYAIAAMLCQCITNQKIFLAQQSPPPDNIMNSCYIHLRDSVSSHRSLPIILCVDAV